MSVPPQGAGPPGGEPVLPTIDDIERAAGTLRGVAVRTPLLESHRFNEACGGRVLFKCESLQRTGSFKFRGAFTAIARMPEAQRRKGVVAVSSGNHAQGVAAAARLFGTAAVIVMPSTAPRIKTASTRALGAEIVTYDPATEDRDALGARIAERRGLSLVRPFDDLDVICGQGTTGLEILEQADALGERIDELLCPCGGGGLIGGIATAMRARSPGSALYAVEPAGFDDTRRSLVAGQRRANEPGATSICDALLSPRPGQRTFAINRATLAGALVVDDATVRDAMRWAFEHLKLVLEPAGATGIAALLAGARPVHDRTVVVVCSGGNVDPEFFADCLSAA